MGIEMAHHLIEDEDGRIADQRAAERHPLLLAAGQLSGLLVEDGLDAQQLWRCA